MTSLSAPAPKVVATDLDGTIVRSDGTISGRTREALLAAQSAGALVIVVTGRPPRWLDGIAEATGQHGLAICANGALVYDLASHEIVDSTPLPDDDVVAVMKDLRDAIPGMNFAVECIDGQFIHEPEYIPRWLPEADTRVGDVLTLATAPIAKLLGRREGWESDDLLAAARAAVGETRASITHSSIDGLLEVNAYGVTKASTLERFLAERGFSSADVIAFGDMPNDVEMLAWAGRGVAMANAHAEVRAVTDEVTLSNDDDGVAVVLERLYS